MDKSIGTRFAAAISQYSSIDSNCPNRAFPVVLLGKEDGNEDERGADSCGSLDGVGGWGGQVANGAPVQWRAENGGNGHWYEVNIHAEGPISWPQADAQANAAGGHLATIGSEAENLFVSNLVAAEPYKPNDLGPWLGGYQPDGSPEPAGGWSWVTGEPWDYTHWGDGEPNNYWNPSTDEEEAYLELFIANTGSVVGYYWNDSWGQSQSPVNWYVVEYEPVPEPATMLLIGTGSLGVFGWIRRKRSK